MLKTFRSEYEEVMGARYEHAQENNEDDKEYNDKTSTNSKPVVPQREVRLAHRSRKDNEYTDQQADREAVLE